MDERIMTPLPVWITAEDGKPINLARVERLYTAAGDSEYAPEDYNCVMALMVTGRVVLATCHTAEQADAALQKLLGLLPIAIVDMTLDVIDPLERRWASVGAWEAEAPDAEGAAQ